MLLELKNIRKYFPLPKSFWQRSRPCVRAVDDVSLSVGETEHLGLVGESGSGKTTLGRIILKLYPSSGGKIFFDGEDLTAPSGPALRKYRRMVQMVFQDPANSLDPRFTIRACLEEALALERPLPDNIQRQVRMEHALASVGMDKDAFGRFPHEFSGGERQRIAIARSLIMRPKLLILDEATSALDVLVQEQILDYLDQLQKEFQLTYLLISHDLRVVKKICRKIAVMFMGRLVEIGPAADIFENPLHPYTKELITASVDHRVKERDFTDTLPEKSDLIDKGNGHFVLNY